MLFYQRLKLIQIQLGPLPTDVKSQGTNEEKPSPAASTQYSYTFHLSTSPCSLLFSSTAAAGKALGSLG